MRPLVDQCLPVSLSDALRASGYDAVHVREIGLSTAPDEVILDRAAVEHRMVISADTDFGYLLRAGRRPVPSVVLLRGATATPGRRLEIVHDVLRDCAEALAAGALVVVQQSGTRVRPLPLEISGGRLLG